MPLPDADFEFIRGLVHRESGIALGEEKGYLVKSRLAPLIAEKFQTFRSLVQHIRTKPNDPVKHQIIDLMTTNESWFFRDLWPFECMKEFVFPQLASKKGSDRNINIWSAACSTGQEPYSLAMTVRESANSIGGWNTKILATDISPTVLEQARIGKFSKADTFRGLTAVQQTRFFSADGNNLVANEDIRSLIEFKQVNLSKTWPHIPQMDVVFLRNVLIYFDVPTKEEIIRKAVRLLNPGGFLFLGGGESLVNIQTDLVPVSYKQNQFYQRAV
jgi:chemotaxis protein methyltransferase CheR